METKQHVVQVDGIELNFFDVYHSETMVHMKEQVFNEDEYNIKKINFVDGDVVIDIGANIGCVSIWLAKKYPFLKIYSFEAHPTNYSNLIRNIEINKVTNIVPHNLAVSSADNKDVKITLNPRNTGSSSTFKVDPSSENTATVKTISLDTILNRYQVSSVKLLKIDCEGSEFDILENSSNIGKLQLHNLAVEIHTFVNEKDPNSLISLANKICINSPICKVYSLG